VRVETHILDRNGVKVMLEKCYQDIVSRDNLPFHDFDDLFLGHKPAIQVLFENKFE